MLFTYVKPCHGTFVMGIDSEEEIARLRENENEKMKRSLKKGAMEDKKRLQQLPVSFNEIYGN